MFSPNEIDLPVSIGEEVERLQQFANNKAIIRHWLEPNFRAPHVYSEKYSKDWLECLLRITKVGKVIPVDDSCESSKFLWRSDKGKNGLLTFTVYNLNKWLPKISFHDISYLSVRISHPYYR